MSINSFVRWLAVWVRGSQWGGQGSNDYVLCPETKEHDSLRILDFVQAPIRENRWSGWPKICLPSITELMTFWGHLLAIFSPVSCALFPFTRFSTFAPFPACGRFPCHASPAWSQSLKQVCSQRIRFIDGWSSSLHWWSPRRVLGSPSAVGEGPKTVSGGSTPWHKTTTLAFNFLVNLFLTNLVRISGFSSLFLAIAVLSAHFARECWKHCDCWEKRGKPRNPH